MANFTQDEYDQIAVIVLGEISQKSPWIQERRITTNGLTSRPKNTRIDLTDYIDSVANIYGINGNRVEYPYNRSNPVYHNAKRKGNILEINYSGSLGTGLAITAVAAGATGTINVTLDVSDTTYEDHELQTNDMCTIVGTTNYNGTKILTRVSATVINVSGTYGATETGNIGEIMGIEFLENHTLGATASSNTMDRGQENAFVLGMIARCWMHYLEEYRLEMADALVKIDSVAARITQQTADISSARTEIGLMNAEVDKSVTAITAARALINKNNTGPDPVGNYLKEAQMNIGVAGGYFNDAAAYMQSANAESSVAASMVREASARWSNAASVMSGGALRIAQQKEREFQLAIRRLPRNIEKSRAY